MKNFLKKNTNRVFDAFHRFRHDPQNTQALALWSAALITGLVAVEYAQLFKFCEHSFLRVYDHNPYLIFIISPLALGLSRLCILKFSPEATGSGIPQVMAANEVDYKHHGPLVDRLLSLRVAVVKIISSVLTVSGGGAIGREGPSLQISACIFHFFEKRIRKLQPNIDSHTWIIAGSAAGLAAAFNTPLGGIVYAIEEMGSLHFHKVKTSLLSSVIIAGLVSQWLLGPYLYIGVPKLLNALSLQALPYALIAGILCGGLGGVFGNALAALVKWRAKFNGNHFRQVMIAALSGVVLSALIWFDRNNAGSGTELIRGLLLGGQHSTPFSGAGRFLATVITYFSGSAGGVFAPAMAAGAAIGSSLEHLIGSGHPNLLILLGMIGFLTGVTRTPFTSFILVLEMTDRHSAIFPMMVCALVANRMAKVINVHGLYEITKLKYMPGNPNE